MNWYVYGEVQNELVRIQQGTKLIGMYTTRYKINWYIYHQVQHEYVRVTTRYKINGYVHSQVYNELFT